MGKADPLHGGSHHPGRIRVPLGDAKTLQRPVLGEVKHT